MATLRLSDFSGGLNLRDSFTEVAPNELSDGTNFTLDERGVASKRNDCPTTAALAGASTPPGAVTAFFYSSALNLFICQVGVTLYKAAPGAASWTSFRTLSNSSTVGFCDWRSGTGGFLVYVHFNDGVRLYDGTTDSLATSAVGGNSLAVWQNKVWMSNQTVPRIYWSNLGDAGVWTTGTDFVDLKEKDAKPITALRAGAGMDVQGRPGLLVFKEDSSYRIYDSTTGAYTTLDRNTGCVGARALTGSEDGRIYVWGLEGLYEGNGMGPFKNIGDKLRPRFLSTTVNATTKPLISAVAVNGLVYFAFPRTSSTIPDAILELNPRTGSIMEAYLNAQVGPFVFYLNSSGVPAASFASASATIKDLYTGTTRTGFTCSLATGHVEPFAGRLARLHHLRPEINPPASSSLAFGLNYQDGGGYAQSFSDSRSFTNSGLQAPKMNPRRQGVAFQATLTDTASPLASLSVHGFSLDADAVER